MSNAITNACRPAQMPPTPKNVLMAIADRADDAGLAWPSIPGLCDATCYSRTAVIEALKWLEQAGLLTIQKSIGRPNRFVIQLEKVKQRVARPVRETDPHQSGRRTGATGEPIRETDPTSPADALVPVRETDPPVRQPDPNHQEPPIEPSLNHQKGRKPTAAADVDRPADVTEQTWADWVALRKEKKAKVSVTALRGAEREAAKLGWTLEAFLAEWCVRGSQGLKAEWIAPQDRQRFGSSPASDRVGRQLRTAALMVNAPTYDRVAAQLEVASLMVNPPQSAARKPAEPVQEVIDVTPRRID